MNITNCDFITCEAEEDWAEVEQLAADAFGPGRFTRTAFRLREGIPHERELSFVYRKAGAIVASVRLTRILIGEDQALLLGPLVVKPDCKNKGYGGALMETCVSAARDQAHSAILLVGDLPYYSKFGFERVARASMQMPGPVDPARLLICPLNLEKGQTLCGPVRAFRR